MNRFATEAEMKAHKIREPSHSYCKKCDVDCDDWEDLTQHEVEMMTSWLEGHHKHGCRDESPKHIVCEFCGMDFKSFGGRRMHRTQSHPAAQSIVCPGPGCGSLFFSAAQMVAHLEQGQCEVITTQDFHGNILQKRMVPEVLRNADHFREALQINEAYAAEPSYPELITDRANNANGYEPSEDYEGGGVLLDQVDEDQKGGYEPLQPTTNPGNPEGPYARSTTETWPRLPGQALPSITESIGGMSIGSSTSEYPSEVTSRHGGKKVYTVSSPDNESLATKEGDAASVASTRTTTSFADSPSPWTTGNTSKALFKDARPNPPPGEWAAILRSKQEEAASDTRTNLLHLRFYDPSSPDYDPDRFLHSVIQKYCCPFPICDDVYYDEPADIEAHLYSFHLRSNYRCPSCLKIFKSATGFVAHSESSTKCRIKDSKHYKQVSDRRELLTGPAWMLTCCIVSRRGYRWFPESEARQGAQDLPTRICACEARPAG